MTSSALLTTTEVARRLRVSPRTVARWAREGTLPGIKVGGTRRFRREDVEALLTPQADEEVAQ